MFAANNHFSTGKILFTPLDYCQLILTKMSLSPCPFSWSYTTTSLYPWQVVLISALLSHLPLPSPTLNTDATLVGILHFILTTEHP
jgi:hypothetical protein